MSEFSKFIVAADTGERPLETDLYTADTQGLEADNIAATGKLNIGQIIEYDARAEHRQIGGAMPASSPHTDGVIPANETYYTPMASQQSYYTSAPTTDYEAPSEEQTYHSQNSASPSYQPNHSEGVNPAAQDAAAARHASSISTTPAPEPPTVINNGGGDTIVTNTYNYTDNSTTTTNYTYNDYSNHSHNIIDIDIGLLNGHGGHGGGGGDGIIPVIINNVFDEITNVTTVVDHTIDNVTDTLSNVVNTVGDTLSNVTGAVGDTLSNITGAVTHTVDNLVDNLGTGLPGLPLGDVLGTVTNTVGNVTDALPHVLNDTGSLVNGLVGDVQHVLADPTTLVTQLPDILGGTVNSVEHVVDDLTGALPQPVSQIVDTTLDTVTGLLHDPAGAVGGVVNTVTQVAEGVTDILPQPIAQVADNVLDTVGNILHPTDGGTILGAVDGVVHGAMDVLPDPIAAPILAATDNVLHTVVGGFTSDAGILGVADNVVQGVADSLPAPLSQVVDGIDQNILHNVVGSFGDHDSGLLSNITTPILADASHLLDGAGCGLPIGGLPDLGSLSTDPTAAIDTVTSLLGGLAGSTPLGGALPINEDAASGILPALTDAASSIAGVFATAQDVVGTLGGNALPDLGGLLPPGVAEQPVLSSLLSSEGPGGGSDGAPLPVALDLADPLTGLLSDLSLPGLGDNTISPIPDITMPINSVVNILDGGDHSTSSLLQAANLPLPDAHDAGATLLALADTATSTISQTLSDAGHLLGGGDATSAAGHAAASLPPPVLPPPVTHILSGLFHH